MIKLQYYGERLKELRLERRLTIQEVALKIGLAKSSYAGYEGGYRHPPMEKLVALAKLYHVSTDYILGLTEVKDEVNSLYRQQFYWDGIRLNEKELEIVHQVVELIAEKNEEKKKENLGRMDIG